MAASKKSDGKVTANANVKAVAKATAKTARAKTAKAIAKAPVDLSEVAQHIAHEVACGDEEGQKTTLRRLLNRCGYQKRTAQTVRRVAAALDAAGVQCLPPPAGVEDMDDAIRLQCAAPRKSGAHSAEKTMTPNDQSAKKATASAARNLKKSTKTAKAAQGKTGNSSQKKQAVFATLEEMLAHARAATVLVKLDDGHGSGLVIDPSGIVLTARHVIENSDEVCLRFEDGDETSGRVLFSDAALDYAFLKCEPRKVFFTIHNDLKLSVGQSIYAVGTPLQTDLAGSVSRGIISGLDRVIGGVNYIQNDAAIHAGHSGGPLLTEGGDVIGVNLWGRPEEGIRFALPMNYVLEAWQVLQPQLADFEARLYCNDCGFLNGPESWILCASWVCCGHCGTVLGDLKADELRPSSDCEDKEDDELKADRAQFAEGQITSGQITSGQITSEAFASAAFAADAI